ncbi:hypothetical protein [Paracoccus mutanolyticus]|uniref:hypothetical protein n=1 Tax=Paracoccus mutanolyticus TaxID=1499308 RepID=UPI0016784F4B|nr:hypothetical protein [Paracoccus mutanolyticus]
MGAQYRPLSSWPAKNAFFRVKAIGRIRRGQPGLGLTQHAHDLGIGETALLHRNLFAHPAEKILPPHPLDHGEDYLIALSDDEPA